MARMACSIPRRSASTCIGTLVSSVSMSLMAWASDILSRFVERGCRCSVGDNRADCTVRLRFVFAVACSVECGARTVDWAAAFLASSTAPQTLSRLRGVTRAVGQSLSSSRPTRHANRGCFSKTLPASTNWILNLLASLSLPPPNTLCAHVAPAWARHLAASSRMPAATLSRRCQAENTTTASPATSVLLAVCAQPIRSFGSLSCSAARISWPSLGQVPVRS